MAEDKKEEEVTGSAAASAADPPKKKKKKKAATGDAAKDGATATKSTKTKKSGTTKTGTKKKKAVKSDATTKKAESSDNRASTGSAGGTGSGGGGGLKSEDGGDSQASPAVPRRSSGAGRGSGRGRGRGPGRGRGRAPVSGRSSTAFRAPERPASILRASSHRPGRGSTRINPDGSVTKLGPTKSSERANEDDSGSGAPAVNMTPDMRESNHYKNSSSKPIFSKSTAGLDGQSTHSVRSGLGSAFQSTRSLLTIDREQEFDDDNLVQQALRYIKILPPHKNEQPIKKWIRIMTWFALLCDFIAAMVSIGTYNGVTYCCGVPILNIAGNVNWDLAIRVVTYIYVVLIFAEIIPVVKQGMPLNLLNPFVGFLITFAVFFDDRILEAVVMWIIEAMAVSCEFTVYRLHVRMYNERNTKLKETEESLQPFKAKRKEKKLMRQSNRRMLLNIEESSSSSDDDSFGGDPDNFKDEDEEEPQDLSQVRELRLLRERRLIRDKQTEEKKTLRLHFTGVVFNSVLVGLTLILIICIGRSGGLCIFDMQPPNVFKTGQLEKCFDCKGISGVCEHCPTDGGIQQCYYPYY